jgi:hypothetical protein
MIGFIFGFLAGIFVMRFHFGGRQQIPANPI